MKRKRDVNVIFDESPPLPEEIIFFEIFARLPIKSVFQFRCVSKFCRSLTSDRLFIAAQCHRSPPTYLLSYPSSSPLYQHVFHYLNPNNHSQSEIFIEHFRDLRYDSYAKSINGLMCMLRGKQVIIRNLVTNNQFVLPYFHSHFQLGKHYVYFCYCPKKDKYKVLVATSKRNRNLNVVSTRYSIFTLGVDEAWRGFDHLGLYQLGQSKSVCVDGVLYCTNFSTTSEVENGIIATFDVGSEDFGVITYPEELSPLRYKLCHLIEVKGVIAIIDIDDLESCVIRMWIRVKSLSSECWIENRVLFPSRWTKIYNVANNFSFTTNRNGEIVLASCGMSTTKCWIFVYNMGKKEWRRIEVLGLQRDVIFGDFLIEDYVEPLLRGLGSPF
ncbi:hypothetical protein BUALT_Bualt05G0137600 [Buddleja alternifolia]|uniref:F-box domain-containing protein n=1 Tax=Buddleja alternifolia TaxID=168488 RepID=A0AAV6XL02_9LAMI|nr:hypothetical protein BUALT_Bualt05G0137600 [Buddleja alternifolia]